MGDVSSKSVILRLGTSQNETKVLEFKENSSNVAENINLAIEDKE